LFSKYRVKVILQTISSNNNPPDPLNIEWLSWGHLLCNTKLSNCLLKYLSLSNEILFWPWKSWSLNETAPQTCWKKNIYEASQMISIFIDILPSSAYPGRGNFLPHTLLFCPCPMTSKKYVTDFCRRNELLERWLHFNKRKHQETQIVFRSLAWLKTGCLLNTNLMAEKSSQICLLKVWIQSNVTK